MSMLDLLMNQLGDDRIREIGRSIGADEGQTKAATGAALSTILAGLARNAASGDGAESLRRALEKDHDGSVLDRVDGQIRAPETATGDGILRHVLGDKRTRVEAGIAQTTGVDKDSTGKLMAMLAPLVMGALGQQQRERKMDAGSLAGFLGRESDEVRRREPQAAGMLGQLLDADGDGDVDMGDLAKRGAGLLGKMFGK